ncbi:barstar family protein [Nonomuraea sp. NPDC050404]|uniref:barstar family protein n=1 Tax=Nonomuraea sp. NPDC050404 TaxID=3155783 RepID=UPI0033CB27A5
MTSAARPLPPWLTVSTAVLDGRACRTRAAFFEEVARALRLPDYFGRNWDALTDSLRDVGAAAVVVLHAGELLDAEPPEQLATLLAVLGDAARDGLRVTLCTGPDEEDPLRDRLAGSGL